MEATYADGENGRSAWILMIKEEEVMSRMDVGKRALVNSAAALAIFVTTGLGALEAQELRILTWEGLAEDTWISRFEEQHGVTVSPTYVGSNDEYMAALAAGDSRYDTVVIVSSLAQPAIQAGFVEPLNLDLVPNLQKVYPEFRDADFLRDGDQQYGAPTFWDIQPVTYNADVVSDCSFDVLFNEEYRGKIAMWDDVSTIGDVASYMGFDDIWNLSDEELEQVKEKMIEQKPLVRRYWSTGGEIIELMASGEVVATNSWSYVTQALKDEGVNAEQCAPERPTAWLDSHFIVSGSQNIELAHEFINFMLEPEVLAEAFEATGFGVTVPEAADHLPEGAMAGSVMEEDAGFRSTIAFWEEIPRRARYLEVWNEVKAAPVE